jgi:uncharacterized integral membrane protein
MPVPENPTHEPHPTGPQTTGPEASRPQMAPDAPEAPPPGAPPRPTPGPAPGPTAEERRALAGDLATVQRGRPERAFNVGAILGAILAVAAAIFVIQNNQSTQFDWLWFDFELPLWTALLGSVAVGVLLVVLAFAVHEWRSRRIGRRHEAVGRIRQALGPSEEPPRRGGFLRRSRRPRPGPGRPGPSSA